MSFRTVVIANRCKLDLRMNYLEVRGSETQQILLDEIDILIIENPAVSLTGCLLETLINKKVRVVFCNSKRDPLSELSPLYGSYDCSRKVKNQIEWSDEIKGQIWTLIVSEKIRKQSELLEEVGHAKEVSLLRHYITEIIFMDQTNREGHSAKVYFNALFGMDFTRNEDCAINAALNYGYSLILSAINREVVANGYLTQLGIFHDNMYNHFNLSCDLMEPYRIIIDRYVYNHSFTKFETEEKHLMLQVLQTEVGIENTRQYLPNAIKIYVKSVFDALCEQDISLISFYRI